jgi:hypothetical protein
MPKFGYSWKYPEKDKFDWKDLIGLLETGFGVYKDLQGIGLQKQQLAQQAASDTAQAEWHTADLASREADRQRLIEKAEADARSGYEGDVVKALESGFQRREPRMPNLDPDEAAALASKNMLPYGSVSRPTLEYEPGKSFLSLLTSGDLVRIPAKAPEPMPDFGPGVTAWRDDRGNVQHANRRDYAEPAGMPTPESPGAAEARLLRNLTMPGVTQIEPYAAEAMRAGSLSSPGTSLVPGPSNLTYSQPLALEQLTGKVQAQAAGKPPPTAGTLTEKDYFNSLMNRQAEYIKVGLDGEEATQRAKVDIDPFFPEFAGAPAESTAPGAVGGDDRTEALTYFREVDPVTPLTPEAEAKIVKWYQTLGRDPESFKVYVRQHMNGG